MGELYLKGYKNFSWNFGGKNLSPSSRGELEIFCLGLLPRSNNTKFAGKNGPHFLKGGFFLSFLCVFSFQQSKMHEKDKQENYEERPTTKTRKRRPQSQQQVEVSNLEMKKQSRGSHRSVATRFNNEAENIMSKDQDTLSEADINRLNQVATLLNRRQNFPVNLNQNLNRTWRRLKHWKLTF